MRKDDLLNADDLQIEPISDQVLNDVLGGLGEEDGIIQSCSKSCCSNSGGDPCEEEEKTIAA